jgi:hypothetical protein
VGDHTFTRDDDEDCQRPPHGEENIAIPLLSSLAGEVQDLLGQALAQEFLSAPDPTSQNEDERAPLTPLQRAELQDISRRLAALTRLAEYRSTGVGTSNWPGSRILLRLRLVGAQTLAQVLAQALSSSTLRQNMGRSPTAFSVSALDDGAKAHSEALAEFERITRLQMVYELGAV